jgi:RimJ/RimL family protein N-acetyltransferase
MENAFLSPTLMEMRPTRRETSYMPTAVTYRLRESDRAAIAQHFLALDGEDRRLRFGSSIADMAIQQYVDRIDFVRDGVFAVQEDEGPRLLAVIHVALSATSAELGLSVLPGHRGQGLGGALFSRAVTYLRNRGTREVFVHCLTENGAMMQLARKNRMRIVPAGQETDARLALDPATADTLFSEWLHDYHAATVKSVRLNSQLARKLLGYFG